MKTTLERLFLPVVKFYLFFVLKKEPDDIFLSQDKFFIPNDVSVLTDFPFFFIRKIIIKERKKLMGKKKSLWVFNLDIVTPRFFLRYLVHHQVPYLEVPSAGKRR